MKSFNQRNSLYALWFVVIFSAMKIIIKTFDNAFLKLIRKSMSFKTEQQKIEHDWFHSLLVFV